MERSFKEWLDILGYSQSALKNMPVCIRELLFFLEQQEIKSIKQLSNKQVHKHYDNLKCRTNQTRGGALSNTSLNYHLKSIRKFGDYLREVGRIEIPVFTIRNEVIEDFSKDILSLEEVEDLFKATNRIIIYRRSFDFIEALKSRDRAMLSIFYGCGARRNEGVNLNVEDIYWDKQLLHIRKAKGRKERFVPIGKTALKHLQKWVYDYRRIFIGVKKSQALFVGSQINSVRIHGDSFIQRIKILQELSENKQLQEKQIGLHSLRHSIATHLLQAGMKLESISKFLGHSSLESTQIYTHILKQETQQAFSNIPLFTKSQLHEDEQAMPENKN